MKYATFFGLAIALYTSLSLAQILNIVAHQDDDLLFLSPDLLHYIQTSQPIRTVFITAGDAGRTESYWQTREAGARAAYALMTDSADSWTEKDAGIPGHAASIFTLNQDPNVSLVFLRLPDGNLDGQGFETTGSVSLQKLWEGGITRIQTVSGGSYTKDELISALVHLISEFGPGRVNTLDFVHSYGDGDHSDHHSAAFFVSEALGRYETESAPLLTGYMGYPVINKTANVVGADLLDKQLAFYAYGRSDSSVCNSQSACENEVYYPAWLERQHRVDESPVANAGSTQVAGLNAVMVLDGSNSSDPAERSLTYEWTQVSGAPVDLNDRESSNPSFTTPSVPDTLVFELVVHNGQTSSTPAVVTVSVMQYPENIALRSKVTASSANGGSSQTPDKAIDESIGGFPADHTHEWATNGGKAGSWLTLGWDSPQVASRIALYDRPNLDDQVTGGVIEFDDGERLEIGALDNYGKAKSFDVGDKTVRNLTIRITSVSPSTLNVGLSEVQVFGTSVY